MVGKTSTLLESDTSTSSDSVLLDDVSETSSNSGGSSYNGDDLFEIKSNPIIRDVWNTALHYSYIEEEHNYVTQRKLKNYDTPPASPMYDDKYSDCPPIKNESDLEVVIADYCC